MNTSKSVHNCYIYFSWKCVRIRVSQGFSNNDGTKVGMNSIYGKRNASWISTLLPNFKVLIYKKQSYLMFSMVVFYTLDFSDAERRYLEIFVILN